MDALKIKVMLIILAMISLGSCRAEKIPGLDAEYQVGDVMMIEDIYGNFFVYAPASMLSQPEILVLIHGTPAKTWTEEETARYYIEHWQKFSEEEGVLLIAPAFLDENFSSRHGEIEDKMTGYRGLFGREIGADEWVLRIIDAYDRAFGRTDHQFMLYGHSAGGQYVGRFLVTHPERVAKAVITAAATYPQPNPEIMWPFGMGELHTVIEWDEETLRQEDVIPDKQKWLGATQIPLTVLVGLNDLVEQPARLGQKGDNRIQIAGNWIEYMKLFAEENELDCKFDYHVIAGKGHSMYGLLEFSQSALKNK